VIDHVADQIAKRAAAEVADLVALRRQDGSDVVVPEPLGAEHRGDADLAVEQRLAPQAVLARAREARLLENPVVDERIEMPVGGLSGNPVCFRDLSGDAPGTLRHTVQDEPTNRIGLGATHA
jgi:hypothetical protein